MKVISMLDADVERLVKALQALDGPVDAAEEKVEAKEDPELVAKAQKRLQDSKLMRKMMPAGGPAIQSLTEELTLNDETQLSLHMLKPPQLKELMDAREALKKKLDGALPYIGDGNKLYMTVASLLAPETEKLVKGLRAADGSAANWLAKLEEPAEKPAEKPAEPKEATSPAQPKATGWKARWAAKGAAGSAEDASKDVSPPAKAGETTEDAAAAEAPPADSEATPMEVEPEAAKAETEEPKPEAEAAAAPAEDAGTSKLEILPTKTKAKSKAPPPTTTDEPTPPPAVEAEEPKPPPAKREAEPEPAVCEEIKQPEKPAKKKAKKGIKCMLCQGPHRASDCPKNQDS